MAPHQVVPVGSSSPGVSVLSKFDGNDKQLLLDSFWYNGSNGPYFNHFKDDTIVPIDPGGLFSCALKQSPVKREKMFIKMVEGFSQDRGAIPKAVVRKQPSRPSTALSRQLLDTFSGLLRDVGVPAGTRKSQAFTKKVAMLKFLIHVRLEILDQPDTHTFIMPVLDFGARVGSTLGASQLVCPACCGHYQVIAFHAKLRPPGPSFGFCRYLCPIVRCKHRFRMMSAVYILDLAETAKDSACTSDECKLSTIVNANGGNVHGLKLRFKLLPHVPILRDDQSRFPRVFEEGADCGDFDFGDLASVMYKFASRLNVLQVMATQLSISLQCLTG
jgi:hypothetical protein